MHPDQMSLPARTRTPLPRQAHRQWLTDAGAIVPEGVQIEISGRVSFAGENLDSFKVGIAIIYKDSYGRLNTIGRERANRALIGCDNQ